MRIDAAHLNLMMSAISQADGQTPGRKAAAPKASASPSVSSRQEQLNISFDKGQIIIYRFLDKQTGDLIQQVPPEEVLRVVRSIQELLQRASEQQQLDIES